MCPPPRPSRGLSSLKPFLVLVLVFGVCGALLFILACSGLARHTHPPTATSTSHPNRNLNTISQVALGVQEGVGLELELGPGVGLAHPDPGVGRRSTTTTSSTNPNPNPNPNPEPKRHQRFVGARNASLPQLRHDTIVRHRAKLREVKERGPSVEVVLLGDSLTHFWERDLSVKVWQRFFGAYSRPLNLGVGGDRTEHLLGRIVHGELEGLQPRVAVLMIGTNNAEFYEPYETFDGIRAIVHEVLTRLPSTHLLLLAIFPRGALPSDPLRMKNDAVNKLLSSHYGKGQKPLRQHERVVFLDIGAAFLDNSGEVQRTYMPDTLHCNVRGYERWAQEMKPTLDYLMALRPAL